MEKTTKFGNNTELIELIGPSGDRILVNYNPFAKHWYNRKTKEVLPKGYITPDGFVIDGDFATVSNQKNKEGYKKVPILQNSRRYNTTQQRLWSNPQQRQNYNYNILIPIQLTNQIHLPSIPSNNQVSSTRLWPRLSNREYSYTILLDLTKQNKPEVVINSSPYEVKTDRISYKYNPRWAEKYEPNEGIPYNLLNGPYRIVEPTLLSKKASSNSGRVSNRQNQKLKITVSSNNKWQLAIDTAIKNLDKDKLDYLDSKGINYINKNGLYDAKLLQSELNRVFGTNLIVDNKWGKNSLSALNLILSNITNIPDKYAIDYTGYIDNNNIYQPNYIEPLQSFRKPPLLNMNNKDIKAIMSHFNVNTSNEQREAFRLWLMGNKNPEYIKWIDPNSELYNEWVAPYNIYKLGGKLVSRNIVTRFKK